MSRILFFHRNTIYSNSGGISRITETLARLFEKNGHIVYYMAAELYRNHPIEHDRQFILPSPDLYEQKNIKYTANFIIEKSIDVIINQDAAFNDITYFFGKLKELVTVRIVTCYHNCILSPIYNYYYQQEYRLKKKHLSFFLYFLRFWPIKQLLISCYIKTHRQQYLNMYEVSDNIVLLSLGQKEEWAKMTGIRDIMKKIEVIPNCLGVPPYIDFKKKNIVLWVGTLEPNIKRPDVLLSMWHSIKADTKDWELIFVGDGIALQELKVMVSKWNLTNVHFTGRIDAPEQYYKEAKILCVTSAHESFSLVTVEAMMHGVVPILFNSFSMAEAIVQNGSNGILVKAFDKKSYAEKLRYLLSSDDAIKRMSTNTYKSIQRYDEGIVYKKWACLIKSDETQIDC